MNRQEYMRQLETLLADMPRGDREDALAYYEDYFQEAGPDREEEIIRDLGSPERLALMIKGASNVQDIEEEGEFTETGYRDPAEEDQRMMPAKRRRWMQRRRFSWSLVLIIVIFASPVILGIGGGLIQILATLVAGIVGVIVGVFALSIGCIGGGIGTIVSGISYIFTSPARGIFSVGVGILETGVGILVLILVARIGGWVERRVPKIIRAIKGLWAGFTHRKDGGTV